MSTCNNHPSNRYRSVNLNFVKCIRKLDTNLKIKSSLIIHTGADLGIIRGGGGSGPEFFKGGGGLRSRSAGIFI